MHLDPNLLERAEQMRAEGLDTEEILTLLRKIGCSPIDSMRVLMNLEGMSLTDAKHRVHVSQAWEDTREAHEAFHEGLVEDAERLARSESVR